MRTSLLCAVLVAGQILALGSLPFEVAEPWDSLWHALAYAALALLLSIAADGARPLAVVLGALAVAGLDEWLQAGMPGRSAEAADLAVGLLAAAATVSGLSLARGAGASAGARLQNGGKSPCAESSER